VKLHASQLVLPIFVTGHRKDDRHIPGFEQEGSPIGGLRQYGYGDNYKSLLTDLRKLSDMGLRNVMLFGVVDEKDSVGKYADDENNCPVINAIKVIRSSRSFDKLSLMADVCLCEYTDHGHCGVLDCPNSETIDNDKSVIRLAEIAQSYADAGADVVVPSDMMDGRIGAIRDRLNASGNSHVAIMSHSSKKASVLYSPFRQAVESTFSGNRKQYQHPVGSKAIAMRGMKRDVSEGADMIMVKPSLMYGDIIQEFAKSSPTTPVAAYVVSGEYKMLNDYGISTGTLSEVVRESHLSLLRAGASILVSYFTPKILGELDKWSDKA
jgi:porphobilinogen synthase